MRGQRGVWIFLVSCAGPVEGIYELCTPNQIVLVKPELIKTKNGPTTKILPKKGPGKKRKKALKKFSLSLNMYFYTIFLSIGRDICYKLVHVY